MAQKPFAICSGFGAQDAQATPVFLCAHGAKNHSLYAKYFASETQKRLHCFVARMAQKHLQYASGVCELDGNDTCFFTLMPNKPFACCAWLLRDGHLPWTQNNSCCCSSACKHGMFFLRHARKIHSHNAKVCVASIPHANAYLCARPAARTQKRRTF